MILAIVIADVLMLTAFVWFYSKLPPQIPLLYSQSWGDMQLVPLWMIVLIPVLMHAFLILNHTMKRVLFREKESIQMIFPITSWFILVCFTLIFIRILLLVS